MDYYIISDDNYFLLGIEALSEQINLDGSVVYLNTGTVDSRFAPASGDVVLLAVHNIITRRRIMQLPVIVRSQLLILLKRSIRCCGMRIRPAPGLSRGARQSGT